MNSVLVQPVQIATVAPRFAKWTSGSKSTVEISKIGTKKLTVTRFSSKRNDNYQWKLRNCWESSTSLRVHTLLPAYTLYLRGLLQRMQSTKNVKNNLPDANSSFINGGSGENQKKNVWRKSLLYWAFNPGSSKKKSSSLVSLGL